MAKYVGNVNLKSKQIFFKNELNWGQTLQKLFMSKIQEERREVTWAFESNVSLIRNRQTPMRF